MVSSLVILVDLRVDVLVEHVWRIDPTERARWCTFVGRLEWQHSRADFVPA